MKIFLVSLLLLGMCVLRAEPPSKVEIVPVETLTWGTDYEEALAVAGRENRLVLLNFTGSDWCGWCHRLRDEVFVKEAFAAYAKTSLVLVEVDFPRRKALAPAVKQQNDDLDKQFKVSGYPTIILVDAQGNELGRTGYMQGGPKTFVRELKRFAAKAGEKKGERP